jgi:hypothetical protein
MRNPNRIKPYCDALATLWQIVPDLRLSQLMYTLMNAWEVRRGSSAFYAEDEEFLAFALEYLNEITEST